MDNYLGLHKSQLDTPALVIDKNKLLNNIMLMQKLATAKSISVRPHAKTHKCTRLAQLQQTYGAIGICITKVSEALIMAQNSVTGLLITSPVITGTKIRHLIEVVKLAPDTILVVDNLDNAYTLNTIFKAQNLHLNILVDIDAGIGRTGVIPANTLDLIHQIIKLHNINFLGIQCYAGHLQHITNLADRRTKSHEILNIAGQIKQQLIDFGIPCKIQTGSGTGTFSIDAEVTAVTEIQPGSYCVMDQEYNDIEHKDAKFLPAMTMLTTVISTNHGSHVTVDAGTKALYRVDTKPKIISHTNLCYDWDSFGDEHGKVSRINNEGTLPMLGEVLELVVAHCDPTINLFDYFYITDNDIVIDRWHIDLRGCCQ